MGSEKNLLRIRILEAKDESDHSHQEIELIYVLSGRLVLSLTGDEYIMVKDGIILINTNKKHSLRLQEKALLCKIYINYSALTRELGQQFINFWCNSVLNQEKSYEKLRNIMKSLIREYASNNGQDSFLLKSMQFSLLDCLTKDFAVQSQGQVVDFGDNRTEEILRYIDENYNRTISINEIANKLYMSESSFSRYFKRIIGTNFVEYVNGVRLHYAIEDLLCSDKSITDISEDSGFSTPSSFNKVFREKFKVSPTAYKKRIMQESLPDKNGTDNNIDAYHLNNVLESMNQPQIKSDNFLLIDADVKDTDVLKKSGNICINAGMAKDLLHGKLREQLPAVKKLGIKYVRICNIFHPEMYIRMKRETEEFNYSNIDNVLDFIVGIGLKPFIDLADKPKQANLDIGKPLFTETETSYRVFNSLTDWENMIRDFFLHILNRYGEDIISEWIFELWYDEKHLTVRNETGQISYIELWKATYEVIKGILPKIKLGGDGFFINHNEKKLIEHLMAWKRLNCRPDFLTISVYPYYEAMSEKDIYAKRVTDWNFLKAESMEYHQLLSELKYPKTDICITEWNTSFSERNCYNDSCAKAAHIVHHMINCVGTGDMTVYSNVSDVLSQFFDSKAQLFGATGLITRDGIPKPAFFAFMFINKLGDFVVKRGEQYIITTNKKNSYYILVCNAKKFNHYYYLKHESEIEINDLDGIFEDAQPLRMKFILKNVEDGIFHVKKHMINDQYGSVLNEWEKMNYIEEMRAEDIEYLTNICRPHILYKDIVAENMTLSFDADLKAHEIALFHVFKY